MPPSNQLVFSGLFCCMLGAVTVLVLPFKVYDLIDTSDIDAASGFRAAPKQSYEATVERSGIEYTGHCNGYGKSRDYPACPIDSECQAAHSEYFPTASPLAMGRRMMVPQDCSPKYINWFRASFQVGTERYTRCVYKYGTKANAPNEDWSVAKAYRDEHLAGSTVDIWILPGTGNCVVGYGSLDEFVAKAYRDEHLAGSTVDIWILPGTGNCVVGYGSLDEFVDIQKGVIWQVVAWVALSITAWTTTACLARLLYNNKSGNDEEHPLDSDEDSDST
eukprot:gnl/TRDRNA2_/TRDRNA2_148922_c1_seq1.p1 gnl/TRDRNA2_/TRDRNA2_148922_c1~~gnl/TRDRNA2_/TRDRNA2_148922_c1_seq1.p1  ORF type:complete len:276 (+),score=30.37 gnl/TRDRNA2_/TRDRNA2_148922_c1_seq1:24-851(+)